MKDKPLSKKFYERANNDSKIVDYKDVKEAVEKWINSLIPDDKPINCINKLKKIFGEFK